MGWLDNIYRLYGSEEEPGADPGMDMVDFSTPPEEQEQTPQPRLIPPTRTPRSRAAFDTYMQHIQSMPTEDNFQPSIGRKIGAALVGLASGLKNPAAGYQMTQNILQTPYRRAMEDWSRQGQPLEKAAGQEFDYNKMASTEDTEAGKLSLRGGELQAKIDQINKNYQIALKNAKSTEERNRLTAQRNTDLKSIADRNLRIEQQNANTRGIEAGASATRAGAYKDWVNQGGGRSNGQNPPKLGDMFNAENDVILEMMAQDPKIREFFEVDDAGNISPKMEDWSPEQAAERSAIMSMIGKKAQERLGGTAVGGAPPIWRMRPSVTVPPNRRRMP